MKKCIIPWDKIESRWLLVIYFYADASRDWRKVVRRDFYSKIIHKPEREDSHQVLRQKAHHWRNNAREPYCFGYHRALIFNHQNPDPRKAAIMMIDQHGNELVHERKPKAQPADG